MASLLVPVLKQGYLSALQIAYHQAQRAWAEDAPRIIRLPSHASDRIRIIITYSGHRRIGAARIVQSYDCSTAKGNGGWSTVNSDLTYVSDLQASLKHKVPSEITYEKAKDSVSGADDDG
ncbi:hypothetical protein LTR37_008612 [Vermiconidia calcicola]|uniref:Uncharacterized protein n=1 Tax=Vermiconidia calcicola TaxID=1690605 RepID=A0ACC3N9Y6_9PEZI|nr:hypothetical protein LTR37_008612 [Vermiconidia calcicola]